MANLQKLVEDGTEVEFDPLAGYVEDRIREVARPRSRSGKLHSYQFFTNKWRYEIPVVMETSADAVQINTWAKDNTELTFYPDLINSPATTRTVHIVNETDPLQLMEYEWKDRYEGTIFLEEI
ncbi:unnamed protein product [marine sediment metagenome]|uniref:Uncharacterized protein n=1 Tax=marine sediment metagenome TaxID=412755 RepID=X1FNX7_9ZZZZ